MALLHFQANTKRFTSVVDHIILVTAIQFIHENIYQ